MHWYFGSAKNRAHGSLVAGLAIASAIQIDDVEPSSASGLPTSRNCDRILIENGLASVIALLKTNATPASDIDSGNDLHVWPAN